MTSSAASILTRITGRMASALMVTLGRLLFALVLWIIRGGVRLALRQRSASRRPAVPAKPAPAASRPRHAGRVITPSRPPPLDAFGHGQTFEAVIDGKLVPRRLYGVVIREPEDPRGQAARTFIASWLARGPFRAKFCLDGGPAPQAAVFTRDGESLNLLVVQAGLGAAAAGASGVDYREAETLARWRNQRANSHPPHLHH